MLITQKIKINLSLMVLLATSMMFSCNVLAGSHTDELLKAANTKESGKYVRQRFASLAKKPFTDNAKKKALIIGDSHAQDFVNMIFENHYWKGYQISTRSIPTQCQPIFNAAKYIAAKDQQSCAKADSLEKAKEQIAQADVVILSANWKDWSAKALPETVKKLGLTAKQKLLIIGRKSFGKVNIRKYLRLSETKLRNMRNQPDNEQEKINNLMKSTLDKSVFVDAQKLICQAEGCRVFTSNLKLISFDGGHLTPEGARYIGTLLFKDSHLSGI